MRKESEENKRRAQEEGKHLVRIRVDMASVRAEMERVVGELKVSRLEEKVLREKLEEEKECRLKLSRELEKSEKSRLGLVASCDERMNEIGGWERRVKVLEADEKSLVECVKKWQVKCVEMQKV